LSEIDTYDDPEPNAVQGDGVRQDAVVEVDKCEHDQRGGKGEKDSPLDGQPEFQI
jgi:hypothetical protein